jgi:hypothetical protein
MSTVNDGKVFVDTTASQLINYMRLARLLLKHESRFISALQTASATSSQQVK